MPDKLLPCPFCGGSNVTVEAAQGFGNYCVFCAKCGPMCFDKYEIDSVHTWNHRADIKEEKILQHTTGTLQNGKAAS